MRIFSTTRSPGCGSRPATGAAPQVPRTIALASSRPSNSGALSVKPGAPGSTTNQTWMIITPRARATSASRRMFSTTFCSRACCGEPGRGERAAVHHHVVLHVLDDQRAARRIERHALPAAGAFGRGRRRSGRAGRSAGSAGARAHERLDMRADLGAHGIERMRCGHEQCAPIGLAPMQIGDQFRHAHLAEQRAVFAVDPDAAGRGHPDVAGAVAFHAVRHAGLELGADAGSENPVGRRACRRH